MRRVDQEQEMIADRFLNYVSEDRLTALRWRHEDRAAAYPAVAAAGKPDRLFAAVSAWAQTLPGSESATVMEHANRVFLQYAEARETAEKKILSVLLRSPLRGPPIPTRFVDPPDPDVDVWEQALNARLAAAATCVAGLLDLLPKEQRAAAEVKPPTEEESYLPLIPRP